MTVQAKKTGRTKAHLAFLGAAFALATCAPANPRIESAPGFNVAAASATQSQSSN